MRIRRRVAFYSAAAVLAGGVVATAGAGGAQAHGAPTTPGSRTYLCWLDGSRGGGEIQPKNSACADAVTEGTSQPLWDWYGVLRSDGAGRMSGYIPDGELCSGGNPKYDAYNTMRDDWPVTHLTAGDDWEFHYNAWAAHPGIFKTFVTKDGFDPTKPLKWSSLESTPFSTWAEQSPNGAGEYYWNAKLPNKSGRHILYTVWARTDSNETFYSCSDVVFDGGNGEVTGIPGMGGDPTGTATKSTTRKSTTKKSTTRTRTKSTTRTRTRTRTKTTTSVSTSRPPTGGCTVEYVTKQWNQGFNGDVTIDPGNTGVDNWTLEWTYPGDQKVTTAFGATYTQTGNAVQAKNLNYNGTIPAHGSVTFQVQGTWGTDNTAPTDFVLNGKACNGGDDPGTTTTRKSRTKTKSVTKKTTKKSSTRTRTRTSTRTKTRTSTGTPTCGTGFCDGFESQTSTTPSGAWQLANVVPPGTGTAVIDSSTAHSGAKSVKINGAGGYSNHVFVQPTQDLSKIGRTWYVRLWVKHTTALPGGHTGFIAMKDANDGGKDLRIGGQGAALQWNRESDDQTLPVQSPTGIAQSKPLPTGTWQCLEYMVDGAAGQAKTWLNGTEVPGLTADGVSTPDIDSQWTRSSWRPDLQDLRLGWEDYGGGSDTLWFDDVAVSKTRVGC